MIRATKVILFISAALFFSLWAGEPKNADAARHGIELAYNMQLDQAERIFDGLIAQNPDDPQGYVLKSVVYYYRYLLDQGTDEIEKQFIKLAKTGIDRAYKRLARDQNNTDALFKTGECYGKLGIREKAVEYYSRVSKKPNSEIYRLAQERLEN
jgi:tetratricopeptide (TPR) repeat protein